MTVAVVLSGFVTMLAQMLISTGMRDNNNERGGVGVIVTVVAMIIAPVAAQLLQLAVSRKREFLADASGAEMTQEPQHLASALQKISSYDKPMEKANYATAHLFISNPFGSHPAGTYLARLFATHPPVEDRVQVLMDMKRQ